MRRRLILRSFLNSVASPSQTRSQLIADAGFPAIYCDEFPWSDMFVIVILLIYITFLTLQHVGAYVLNQYDVILICNVYFH